MKKFLSLYVGDKKFYSMLLKVCLPIIIQNAISQFVNLLDNIMVGQTGTDPMTGVSVSNQLIFVFNIIIFGSVAGAGIFCAQFFGKNDQNGVRYTMRFKLIICTVVGVLGMIVFWLFKEPLLGLYMQGGEGVVDPAQVMEYGKSYVNVMLFGLLPFAISQAYSSTLRETGETFLPMISGVVAVGVNLVGNYILIFGHFGAPALGVVGAAIATVASRYVEMGILIVLILIPKSTPLSRTFTRVFISPRALSRISQSRVHLCSSMKLSGALALPQLHSATLQEVLTLYPQPTFPTPFRTCLT